MQCTLSGWGLTRAGGSPSLNLLKMNQAIISKSTCQNAHRGQPIYDSHLCAYNQRGIGACQVSNTYHIMINVRYPDITYMYIYTLINNWFALVCSVKFLKILKTYMKINCFFAFIRVTAVVLLSAMADCTVLLLGFFLAPLVLLMLTPAFTTIWTLSKVRKWCIDSDTT